MWRTPHKSWTTEATGSGAAGKARGWYYLVEIGLVTKKDIGNSKTAIPRRPLGATER